MRWPFTSWLRGTAGLEDDSPGAPGTSMPGTSTPEADTDADAPPAGEARPAAWRELAPVQRAVGETPVTAPSTAFARGLAGRRVPEPMLAPLAHDMTADGPAGLVSGIAVPLVQRQASGADPRPTSAMPAAAAADRARSRPRGTLTTVARLPMADGERATDDASRRSCVRRAGRRGGGGRGGARSPDGCPARAAGGAARGARGGDHRHPCRRRHRPGADRRARPAGRTRGRRGRGSHARGAGARARRPCEVRAAGRDHHRPGCDSVR